MAMTSKLKCPELTNNWRFRCNKSSKKRQNKYQVLLKIFTVLSLLSSLHHQLAGSTLLSPCLAAATATKSSSEPSSSYRISSRTKAAKKSRETAGEDSKRSGSAAPASSARPQDAA